MPRKGTLRTYQCPADHKHSTTATCYQRHGCGCDACVAQNTARVATMRKDLAYGRYTKTRVKVTASLAHIEYLKREGMSARTIAEASGLNAYYIEKLHRQVWIPRVRANAILNVTPTVGTVLPGCQVDGTGTRRRLQALVYMGWTGQQLMERLGKTGAYSTKLCNATTVFEETRVQVAALYEQMWRQPAPDEKGNRRAALRARRKGWVGPLHWDDIDHDPAPSTTGPDTDRSAWVVDELDNLREAGESPDMAAMVLGRKRVSMARLAARYGRTDLAQWMERKTAA